VRVGEETWIFYEGGGAAGIGLARGRGRGPFVRAAAAPVLAPATGWEAGRAGSPAALPREDGWPLLFSVGGSEAGVGAARAVGDLPERFERVGASPLLVPQDLAVPDRWTALDGVGDPDAAAVSAGDLPFLFVTAHGRVVAGDGGTPEAERDWSIGAVMLEGDEPPRGWTVDPFGPVLAGRTGVGGASPREERAPGVVRAGGGWRMLYEEWEGDTNVRRLRAAGCP
jgi:hypothetical protein